MQPKVAIVGRPNVGKSTLFNMLAHGASRAITHPTAGTTRDVRTTPAELFGLAFTLLDTAGIEQAGRGITGLQGKLNTLALAAATRADILIFVLDGAHGVLPADRALAQSLRKLGKPVIPVLNKADLKTATAHTGDVESFGFGEPILMSAAHSQGLDALHNALAAHIPHAPQNASPEEEGQPEEFFHEDGKRSKRARQHEAKAARNRQPAPPVAANAPNPAPENAEKSTAESSVAAGSPACADPNAKPKYLKKKGPTRLAILGRPNVGKSTLINALLRTEAMLTGPEAGLTREAISHNFTYKNNEFVLTDTPGLRRKSRIDENDIEFLSVGQSLQAAEKADIIVLVVDASGHNVGAGKWEIFEQQDAQIAMMVMNQFKPLVIALSKWDLVEDKEACLEDIRIQLHHKLHALHTPLAVPLNAPKGKGIKTLLDAILKVKVAAEAEFSTGKLNNLLNKVLAKRSPPLANGKVVSLKFIRQTGNHPPSFTFWGNRISEVSGSYKQFLRNQLAEALGLEHNPVNIYFRANANPFGSRKVNKK